MTSRLGLSLIFFIFLSPPAAPAAVIHVPADQATIQAGINAASGGDIVLVADGTYTGAGNRDLDFGGRAITLRSANGPAGCVIDCQGTEEDPHRGFLFQSGEGIKAVLEGFTITNGGWLSTGGAIACLNSSSPTIIGNIITGNSTDFRGGGIDCSSSSPTIKDNTISGNTAAFFGSGIACEYASPLILCNTITLNTGASSGGGIYCDNASPTLMNNVITGNTTTSNGGGIYCFEFSSPIISYNDITDNTADGHGGGIYCFEFSSPTVMSNIISGNTATVNDGGGIYCYNDASPILVNNIITGNTANLYGGGIFFRASSAIIASCIFSANTASLKGGGIYSYNYSVLTITNSIFWNNTSPAGKEMYIGVSPLPSTLTISYSDVDGGQASVFVDPNCTLNWGSGMINDDPLFVTGPLGDYYLSQIIAGQGADSPCLDTGDKAVGLTPWSEMMPVGTTATDHLLDTGILDIGFHYPIMGVAIAGGPYTGRIGHEITFDASCSFDPSGSITGYRWDFENDGTWDTGWLGTPTTTRIYTDTLQGRVKLQIMDSDGFTDSDLADVVIVPPSLKVRQWLEMTP